MVSGDKVSYVCDNIDTNAPESEEDHLFCTNEEVIHIREATYGNIDGGSKCYIANEEIMSPIRNGC